MTRRIFVLALAPDKQLEVSAVSVSQVVDASTAALPHLGAAEHERSTSLEVSQGIRSPLTCLLCGLVNPQHALHTPLVAMQEHVWTEHGLPYEEQAQAASVFAGTPEEGHYVWWTPTHGAYVRASRYACCAEEVPPYRFFSAAHLPRAARQERKLMLSSLRVTAGEPIEVQVAGMDERAWYGTSPSMAGERLLMFPRIWWAIFSGNVG